LITDITQKRVENFIGALKQKGLKSKSIKNIVTDLRAMFHWAMEPPEDGGPGLLDRDPVTKSKKISKLIGSTRVIKKAINPRWFDIAASAIENKRDRAWFDVTRYLGMRKDESNRLQWSDIDWRTGKVRIPGTKTPETEPWLPVAPAALRRCGNSTKAKIGKARLTCFLAGAIRPKARRFTAGGECLNESRR